MISYICDDRVNFELLGKDLAVMTDEEFATFEEQCAESGKYPDKYYYTA